MAGDPWLARWLPLLAERAGGRPVLELGCGGGRDTATLAEAGHRVIGVELSAAAASRARDRVPSAEIHCQDIRAPFPITGPTGVALASLSLHYFGWAETCDLVDRVRDALAPEGVLLCRLNSTNDHHFGASGHPEIEKNFYEVDGAPKRFFDREAIDRLFARGWRALAIGEMVIDRYDHPKSVWEAVLERND
ncbi:class I SAM-dependent methyltransferase [uncultured Reyranella sp.]|uniref:class I SAM-dependent methyltransferase n=1 Tax=uncultured Reyranella sp. TaxID=735512 RepID=UPI00259CAD79|nr:class I SAM-dependent methyltransferase [uncultured Reyranella sp.]